MSVRNESVEEWARTAQFPDPVRWGDVEAGVLARPPAESESLGRSIGAIRAVTVPLLLIAFLVGPGIALLGLLAVFLGTSQDPSAGESTWLSVAQVIFVIGAITEVAMLINAVRERRRDAFTLLTAVITAVACAGAFVLVRSSGTAEPTGLSLAAASMGLLALGILAAGLLGARPQQPGPNAGRKPPRRGPRKDDEYWHYVRTRRLVLDTLVRRGVVHVDEADRRRLDEMPLGYWEELDGVDERERRRILEYRSVGWREFDAGDERPWPPV